MPSAVASGVVVDEQTLIRAFFDRASGQRPDVILGIGDDAAVLRLDPGFDLVVATDTIIQGVHFPPETPPRAIGHRCLAVNLSDLAAMGSQPLWFSLALALPQVEEWFLVEFAGGLFALADRFGVALVGGDTVRGPLAATVTVQGQARPGQVVRRSGASPGDGVWVTGHPGDAVAGRLLLAKKNPDRATRSLHQCFLYPEPRVQEGLALAGLATAMLDISDGLNNDLSKLLQASGVGAELEAAALPISAELRQVQGSEQQALEWALAGGDDYELLFTVAAADESRLGELAAHWPVPVTRIGTVVRGSEARWQHQGRQFLVPDTAFRHF